MEVGGPGRGHLACGGPAWTLTPVPGQPCATMRLLNLLRRSGSERQAESKAPLKSSPDRAAGPRLLSVACLHAQLRLRSH